MFKTKRNLMLALTALILVLILTASVTLAAPSGRGTPGGNSGGGHGGGGQVHSAGAGHAHNGGRQVRSGGNFSQNRAPVSQHRPAQNHAVHHSAPNYRYSNPHVAVNYRSRPAIRTSIYYNTRYYYPRTNVVYYSSYPGCDCFTAIKPYPDCRCPYHYDTPGCLYYM